MYSAFHNPTQIPVRPPLIQGNFVSFTRLMLIVNPDPFYAPQPQIFMPLQQRFRIAVPTVIPVVGGFQEQVQTPASAKYNRSNRNIVHN